jgi:hypothetical protein
MVISNNIPVNRMYVYMTDRECREKAGVRSVRGGVRRVGGSIHGTSLSGLSTASIVVCFVESKRWAQNKARKIKKRKLVQISP